MDTIKGLRSPKITSHNLRVEHLINTYVKVNFTLPDSVLEWSPTYAMTMHTPASPSLHSNLENKKNGSKKLSTRIY